MGVKHATNRYNPRAQVPRQGTVSYGARFTNPGFFAKANGEAAAGQFGADGAGTRHVVVASSNVIFGWTSSTGDATTKMRLWVNGVADAATIDLTGSEGVIAIPNVFLDGDLVSVEFDSGTVPNFTIATLFLG